MNATQTESYQYFPPPDWDPPKGLKGPLKIGIIGQSSDEQELGVLIKGLQFIETKIKKQTPKCRMIFKTNDKTLIEKLEKEKFFTNYNDVSIFNDLKAQDISQSCDLLIVLWDGIFNPKENVSTIVERLISEERRDDRNRRLMSILSLSVASKENPFPTREIGTWNTLILEPIKKTNYMLQIGSKIRRFLWRYKIVLFALASLVCSSIGLYHSNIADDASPIDDITYSFGYLCMSGFEHIKTPAEALSHFGWMICGRVLGILFFLTATYSVFAKIFSIDLRKRWNKLHKHDIICGLGWRGRTLLEKMAGLGNGSHPFGGDPENSAFMHTNAIDLLKAEEIEEISRKAGTSVTVGNAVEESMLRDAGVNHKLERIFINTDCDDTNIQIAHTAANILFQDKKKREKRANWVKSVMSRFFGEEANLVKRVKRAKWVKYVVSLLREETNSVKLVVSLSDVSQFSVLEKSLPKSGKESPVELIGYHAEAITARMLLKEFHLDRFLGYDTPKEDKPKEDTKHCKGARILLVGEDSFMHALFREIVQQGIYEEGRDLQILWIAEKIAQLADSVQGKFPCFCHKTHEGKATILKPEDVWRKEQVLPEVRFYELPVSARGQLEVMERLLAKDSDASNWANTVIISRYDPSDTASLVINMAPAINSFRSGNDLNAVKNDVALWFHYNTLKKNMRFDLEKQLNADYPNLHVVALAWFLDKLDKDLILGKHLDRIAKRINYYYLISHKKIALRNLNKINALNSNVSEINKRQYLIHKIKLHLVDKRWVRISENDKESNRQAAAHIYVKLRIRMRLHLENLNDDAIISALAEVEHRRWCAEQLMKGFRPLTAIPSQHSDWKITGTSKEEDTIISEWYNGGKDNFKNQLRHFCLIPFKDFASFKVNTDRINLERSKEKQINEIEKDHNQVKNIDAFLSISPHER